MDLFDAIRKRHSYRGPFKQEPVSRETLRQIVEAGLQAPSGKNEQTTTFVIVDDEALLRQIRELHSMEAVQQATAVIVCLIDNAAEGVYHGMSFQVEDCAAAVENMLLATTALGCATVWIDGALRLEGRSERIAELIGAPKGKQARILLPIGFPAEERTSPAKKSFEERAWFNRYDDNQ